MDSNATIEREIEENTVETPTVPNKPDVRTFKSIVKRHCDKWNECGKSGSQRGAHGLLLFHRAQ